MRFLHICGLRWFKPKLFERTSLETTRLKFLENTDKKIPNWCRREIGNSELPTSAESWRSRLSLLQVWRSPAFLSCKETWRIRIHGNAWQHCRCWCYWHEMVVSTLFGCLHGLSCQCHRLKQLVSIYTHVCVYICVCVCCLFIYLSIYLFIY